MAATPVNVPATVTTPTATFKKEVSKVMGLVVLFFVVYLLLICLPVLLATGLVGLGVLVFIFQKCRSLLPVQQACLN